MAESASTSATTVHSQSQDERPASEVPAPSLSPSLQVKHPLNSRWTLWFDAPCKRTSCQEEWVANLKRLIDFDTVEDFWCAFKAMVSASQIAIGANFHLFKTGIEPKWEDTANALGGKWVATLAKRPVAGVKPLDELWMYTLMSCIGEEYGDLTDTICGVVVSPRAKVDRISLWTSNREDTEGIRAIGIKFKQVLELPETVKIGYSIHQDSVTHNSSWAAAKLEL